MRSTFISTETVVTNNHSDCFRRKFGGASIASTKGACSTDVGQKVVVAIDLPSNTYYLIVNFRGVFVFVQAYVQYSMSIVLCQHYLM